MEHIKVIFHIDELNKWPLALKNVNNLIDALNKETDYTVEVLANSEAVKYYTGDGAEVKSLEKLNDNRVFFVACNNALKANNIDKNNLLPFVNIVPAGVLELTTKQHEGFAYIKP